MTRHVKMTRVRVGNFLQRVGLAVLFRCTITGLVVVLLGGCAADPSRPVVVVDDRAVQVLEIVQQAGGGPVVGAEDLVTPWRALLHRLAGRNSELSSLVGSDQLRVLIADDPRAWSFANAAGVVLSRGMIHGRTDETGRAAILALSLARWQAGSGSLPLQYASYLVGPPSALDLTVGPLEAAPEISVRNKASRWLANAGLADSGLAYAESAAGRGFAREGTLHTYRQLDGVRESLHAGEVDSALERLAASAQNHPAVQALGAEIALARGLHSEARSGFEQALGSGVRHFRWQLGLGKAQAGLGEHSEAREALTRSAEILPTADAYYHLAVTFPAGSPQRDELLTRAAVSPSNSGVRAQKELIASKILAEPGRFLAIRPRFDAMGQVYLEVENKTQVGMRDLEFSVTDPHDQGRHEVYRLDRVAGHEVAILIMDPGFAPALDRLLVRLKSALMAEN